MNSLFSLLLHPLVSLLVGSVGQWVPGDEIPFVGCPADGQMGRQAAPQGGQVPRIVSPEMASRLAYYSDHSGVGLLAPRGWHCASLSGSNGGTLMVSPDAQAIEDFLNFRRDSRVISGVELSFLYGDTSGRFDVARVIARHFPAHLDFARRVEAEELGDPLPDRPYPADEVHRISATEIEFVTPAGQGGAGTERSRFAVADSPVRGHVLLYPDAGMIVVELAYRLPEADQALALAIVEQVRSAGADIAG